MCRRLILPALAAAAMLVAILCRSARAHADEEVAIHALPVALHAEGLAGYSNYSKAGGGLTLGADVLARHKRFQAGLLVDSTAGAGTSGNGSETAQTYGAMAGLAFYGQRFGVDLLAVGGAHVYEHVSQSLETGGVNGVAPFVQARAGINLLTMRPLSLGLWGFVGDDLTRSTKAFTIANRSPGGGLVTDTASVGESSWGIALRIGIDFGI